MQTNKKCLDIRKPSGKQTNDANQRQTCLVEVPGQLHGGLHLHVVLEEALSERSLVVGLARLGLDGRLHAGLGHLRRGSPDAAHCVVVVPPVRHRMSLLRAPHGAQAAIRQRDKVRKHPLQRIQRLAAFGVQRDDLGH